MNKIKFLVLILIITTTFSCDKIFKSETTQIYGKITDVETKEPLDSVKVSVYIETTIIPTQYVIETYTDENGEYELQFNQEEDETYKIKLRKAFFEYEKADNRESLNVFEGRNQKKNFKLYKYGKTIVYGIVRNKETQEAIKNVEIKVIHKNDTIENVLKTVKTDERGFYSIDFFRKFIFDTHILSTNIAGYKNKTDLIRVYSESSEIINFELETE